MEEPVRLPSSVGDEWEKLDIACVEGLILTTEGEDPTKILVLSSLRIQESGKPEAQFGGRQLIARSEGLPEWGGLGVCDGVEGETHDTGVGTIQKAGRGLIDQQPRLALNLETSHGHSIPDEITGDGTGAICDCYPDWLTVVPGCLEGT